MLDGAWEGSWDLNGSGSRRLLLCRLGTPDTKKQGGPHVHSPWACLPAHPATAPAWAQTEGELTWVPGLQLLLLVVVNDDVCLHGDQLLPVELAEVQQSQLIKLLVAEQNLRGPEDAALGLGTSDRDWGGGAGGAGGVSHPERPHRRPWGLLSRTDKEVH